MVKFRTLRGGSRATSSLGFLDSRLQPKRVAWKNPVGHGPGETRGPGELGHIHGSPPQSSRRDHSEKKENEQRSADVSASDLTSKIHLWESQAPEARGKVWDKEDLPSVKEAQAKESEQLNHREHAPLRAEGPG